MNEMLHGQSTDLDNLTHAFLNRFVVYKVLTNLSYVIS